MHHLPPRRNSATRRLLSPILFLGPRATEPSKRQLLHDQIAGRSRSDSRGSRGGVSVRVSSAPTSLAAGPSLSPSRSFLQRFAFFQASPVPCPSLLQSGVCEC